MLFAKVIGSLYGTAPLLLLLLQLLCRQVVELWWQFKVLCVGRCPERLRLSVQLGSDRLSSLQTISPLLHQLESIGTVLC